MVFYAELKSVLHTEMTKKNLFVKKGGDQSETQILFCLNSFSIAVI